MDWGMIGAVGELLGAAGVIASLLYLGRQIRHSRESDRRARYDGLMNASSEWTWSVAKDGETASIVFRGIRDLDSLNPEDRFRFYAAMLALFRTYEAVLQYSAEGDIHAWGRDSFDIAMRQLLGTPGMKEWWADRREWFAPEARAVIDQLVAGSDATALLTSHPTGSAE